MQNIAAYKCKTKMVSYTIVEQMVVHTHAKQTTEHTYAKQGCTHTHKYKREQHTWTSKVLWMVDIYPIWVDGYQSQLFSSLACPYPSVLCNLEVNKLEFFWVDGLGDGVG